MPLMPRSFYACVHVNCTRINIVETMLGRPHVNVKVEPAQLNRLHGSSFTFTGDFPCTASTSLMRVKFTCVYA